MNDSAIRASLDRMTASPDPDTRAIAAGVLEYLETRDPAVIGRIPTGASKEAGEFAKLAATTHAGHPDTEAVRELVALLISARRYDDALVNPPHSGGFAAAIFIYRERKAEVHAADDAFIAASRRVGVPDEEMARYVLLVHGHNFSFGWKPLTPTVFGSNADPRLFRREHSQAVEHYGPFERLVWNLSDEALVRVTLAEEPATPNGRNSGIPPEFLGALAASKPRTLDSWVTDGRFNLRSWQHILLATREFDESCFRAAEKLPPGRRQSLLVALSGAVNGGYLEATRAAVLASGNDGLATGIAFLADHFPLDLALRLRLAIEKEKLGHDFPEFVVEKAFHSLAGIWTGGGREFYDFVVTSGYQAIDVMWSDAGKPSLYSHGIRGLLAANPALPVEEIRQWTSRAIAAINGSEVERAEISELLRGFWTAAVAENPAPLREELMVLLGDKLKTLRQLAVTGLAKIASADVILRASELLAAGKLDQKLGAAALLAAIPDSTSVAALKNAIAAETNDKVRAAIHEALESKKESASDANSSEEQDRAPQVSLEDLEESFAKQSSKLKLPPTTWLKPDTLPPLLARNGAVLSSDAIAFLLSKQAKHKTLDAAPDLLPLLSHIDLAKSPPFAAALVEGFLNSGQTASDRWALTLGGVLGDSRIIPPLLSRIQDWCDHSRCKLAEYAAQAISLLPGNEPLMVLDTLSNRYRSKYKNVGKACAEAFNSAATARGITADELGDLVVPDFGFDAEGTRRFEWDGGGVSAQLEADFKISWFDPETEKEWKSLPANAPEAIKTEVKTLTKLLREAVKGQTARLEMTLVRQRRWPVARWRELFENHPLLRSFASNLVWGVYESTGELLRAFRRYPNGLLADATGGLEELPESDMMIGMVHPLELDVASLEAWRAHLTRFKVKAPFPQIDRPVELLDPLHGNRREISLTKEKKLSAGTFRSRAEKRGWIRGSVIDAGGISSYYKLYPGAGVEVNLPTGNFWIGCDPMETIELGAACFAIAGTIERGSYTYNEPEPDDPRVLRFDQVPPVVYSETLSDLKAIIATKE